VTNISTDSPVALLLEHLFVFFSVTFLQYNLSMTLTAAAMKKKYWQSSVYQFTTLVNSASTTPAPKGGQVLPHFKHIVSAASTPPCPIVAVF
jgi:hypothetical protein